MKELYSIDQDLGGDGAKVKAAVSVNSQDLMLSAQVSYPLEKILQPATKAVDSLLDRIEKAIPGDWDKPMIEGFKAKYREELVELLTKAESKPA